MIRFRLLACLILSLMLYGEQAYVVWTLCDHDQPHAHDQAGVRDSHAEADPSGSLPVIPCHNCAVCLCHLLALVTSQTPLINPFPSADALSASSDLFTDIHPLKVFRPPIS